MVCLVLGVIAVDCIRAEPLYTCVLDDSGLQDSVFQGRYYSNGEYISIRWKRKRWSTDIENNMIYPIIFTISLYFSFLKKRRVGSPRSLK